MNRLAIGILTLAIASTAVYNLRKLLGKLTVGLDTRAELTWQLEKNK